MTIPASNAEVKDECSYTSAPSYACEASRGKALPLP
jgi:hypothetical protein